MIELKLVDDNVAFFPTDFIPSVVTALRSFADLIEDGEIDARRAVIIAQDREGVIECMAVGERMDSTIATGLIELGKQSIINGATRA